MASLLFPDGEVFSHHPSESQYAVSQRRAEIWPAGRPPPIRYDFVHLTSLVVVGCAEMVARAHLIRKYYRIISVILDNTVQQFTT